MTYKSLIINNNKILLKEVEANIKQILSLTGIEETASFTFDMTKVVLSNVELLVNTAFSFRSFSFEQITKNLNVAEENFNLRTRRALQSADSTINNLAKESYFQDFFKYTAPSVVFIDYFQREVSNSGGLDYFLKNGKIQKNICYP